MAPFLRVSIILRRFVIKAVPELKQLYDIFCCLLEDDQSIYAPSVKPQAIAPVKDQLCEELKHADDYFIVVMESIQSAFNDWTEILRVQPIEKVLKVSTSD